MLYPKILSSPGVLKIVPVSPSASWSDGARGGYKKNKFLKHSLNFCFLFGILLFLSGCEKVIDIELDEGTSQLVVDAFLTNQMKEQKVILTMTSSYFDNSPSPVVTGAQVQLTDEITNIAYDFTDIDNDGVYTWTPAINDTLQTGHLYTLNIISNGENYISQSLLNPVPPIDSMAYEFQPAQPPAITEGYIASFYAIDIPGRVDYYWIRTTRNDTLLNDPSNINISTDGAFTGSASDGFTFILPVRQAITPFDRLYQLNDSINVELWSINEETFYFLSEAQSQLTNAGLFAEPPANVPTNIYNVDSNSLSKPVGWFIISAISEDGIRIL